MLVVLEAQAHPYYCQSHSRVCLNFKAESVSAASGRDVLALMKSLSELLDRLKSEFL